MEADSVENGSKPLKIGDEAELARMGYKQELKCVYLRIRP